MPASTSGRFHRRTPSYSARSGKLHPRSALPVYQRQLFPERVFGEGADDRGTTVWENEGVRLWNCLLYTSRCV